MADDTEWPVKDGSVPERGSSRNSRFRKLIALLLPENTGASAETSEDHILSILAVRRGREQMLGRDLFSDPAWDILLELYAARLAHRQMTASDLSRAIDIPMSTTARWVTVLTQRGLITSAADDTGSRSPIELTSDGAGAMKRLVGYWKSAFRLI